MFQRKNNIHKLSQFTPTNITSFGAMLRYRKNQSNSFIHEAETVDINSKLLEPITSDKRSIHKIIFVVSAQKHILWVLIGIASVRQFQWVPIRYVFVHN